MGSGLERRVLSSPTNLKELFETCCVFYMSIGMGYAEFWEDDVCLPRFYLKAYKEKRERELQQTNYAAWLNGRYAYEAYAVVLSNAFSKSGSDMSQYPEKPYDISSSEKGPEDEEKDLEAEQLRVKAALDSMVGYFKKRKEQNNV